MHRFYVNADQISEGEIKITGADVNHIKNVLRMKQGEEILICNGHGKDCYCIINQVSDKEIIAKIQSMQDTGTELATKIILFQGMPKKDKMELIIQKAVELGVSEIVPVITKRAVVKLEDKKKEEKKLERWRAIAEGAAKQSGRGIIPTVASSMSMKEALTAAAGMELGIIPYENAKGMKETRAIMEGLHQYKSIAIFIGPEGGFEESEITLAKENHIKPITLGKRILRTETAGLCVLSMMVLMLEE